MIGRRQLPIASPISIAGVAGAFIESALGRQATMDSACALLEQRYGASRAVLTDSGTSALALAIRLVVSPGNYVGLPGYGCVDLVAAAQEAGVRVRLYDIDPATLGPDMESVEHLLRRGVSAIVVAHLYAYPADVAAVRALAAREGVPVIEDVAQGSGGQIHGRRLGSHGDLAIMSFGRGKGLCAGGGGALIATSSRWSEALSGVELKASGRGLASLAKTAVQWALGRPSVYAIPAAIPWLRLGEVVYHAPTAPAAMPIASAALLPSALALENADVAIRRAHAATLEQGARTAPGIETIRVMEGAVGGYLRFAVRDATGGRIASPERGVIQPYPVPVAEMPQVQAILAGDERPTSGASELCRRLFTLPTHRFVNRGDLRDGIEWMRNSATQPIGITRTRVNT